MDIIINQTELKNALSIISMAVEKKQTNQPITNHILFRFIDHEKLKLTATDLELEISFNVSYTGDASESLTVSGRKLAGLVTSLPNDSQIRFRIKDKKLLITCKNSRYNLIMLPAESFPLAEVCNKVNCISLEQKQFKYLIDSVSYCHGEHDVRAYLNGILFDLKNNEIHSVATDGHRIARNRLAIDDGFDSGQYIIPKKGISALGRLLRDVENKITLSFTENHIAIRTPKLEFTCLLIAGKFPDYEKAIPEISQSEMQVRTDVFKQMLEMGSAFSGEEKTKPITLDISKDKLNCLIRNQDEEHINQIPVSFNNDDLHIGFNAKYLLEATNKVQDEMMTIFFGGVTSPILIADASQPSISTVVLPMRV